MLIGSTQRRERRKPRIDTLRSERRITTATKPEFTAKCTKPATRPAASERPVPCTPEPTLSIELNAAHAATFARKWFDMLKNVRNAPPRLRILTPSDSATAPPPAPTGPSATDKPRWTNVVGVQVMFAGGRCLMA